MGTDPQECPICAGSGCGQVAGQVGLQGSKGTRWRLKLRVPWWLAQQFWSCGSLAPSQVWWDPNPNPECLLRASTGGVSASTRGVSVPCRTLPRRGHSPMKNKQLPGARTSLPSSPPPLLPRPFPSPAPAPCAGKTARARSLLPSSLVSREKKQPG